MTFGAYLYVNRGEIFDLPYLESIQSVLWCDEVWVGTDPRFDDGTLEILEKFVAEHNQVFLHTEEFNYDAPNPHGYIKQILRDKCESEWLIEMDADEFFVQKQIQPLKDMCERTGKRIFLIEVGEYHLFNGNHIHKDMPIFRPLVSRNTPIIRHDIGEANIYGRMGACYLTDKGSKFSANVRFSKKTLLHYGWYSLPRKWEMLHHTLHYYEGRLSGKYNGLDDYTKNLDGEDVLFWDIPSMLPIENYISAIHKEMRTEPTKKFKGSHPDIMKPWIKRQRIWTKKPPKLKNLK